MSDSTKELRPVLPMYSGQIIGTIIRALDLDHQALKSRTARRFFAGEPVNEHDRTEIFLALGEVLIESGIVPEPPLFLRYDASLAKMLPAAIARTAVRWDDLVAVMQSHSGTTRDPGSAITSILRLVVVDAAIRVFAFMRLAGLNPSPPGTPLWAQANGGGNLLRAFMGKAGLTRSQLAALLEVSETSVDNWLDGKNRPTTENIAAIANVLAPRMRGVGAQQLLKDIRLQFALATLADLLAAEIGRDQVIDLSTALIRFIWQITQDVNEMERPPIEEACRAEYDAMAFGTAHPSTHALLRNLAILETDADWKQNIIAASLDWSLAFQMARVRQPRQRSAAGLAQDFADVSDTPDPGQEALDQFISKSSGLDYRRVAAGNLMLLSENLGIGITHLHAIARDFPASPRAHFQLGSLLGKAGELTGRRDLVNQGITECKIAAALLPSWDNPAVETGIMLANFGAFDEALLELNQVAERLPVATPHLQFATGYVLMKLLRHSEALLQLESVIGAKPDYALAHLHAAHCSFALGNQRKGINYAKTARRLGESGEYVAWKSGTYARSEKNGKRAKVDQMSTVHIRCVNPNPPKR